MDATTHAGSTKPTGLRARAKSIRYRARSVLDAGGRWHNRMTLILSQILLLVVFVAIYGVSAAVYALGYLLVGEALWLDAVAYGLMAILGIIVGLPLTMGVWRLVCRMTLRAVKPGEAETLPLDAILYPLSSLRAYGRCLLLGLEILGWILLIVGIPLGGYRVLAGLFEHLSIRGLHTTLCHLLTVLSFLVCLIWAALMLLLSGKRMGYGYFVFTREETSLREIKGDFKHLRRGVWCPFVLRLSLVGWVALSVVGILIPFVVHTIPYGLFCSAVYGSALEEK